MKGAFKAQVIGGVAIAALALFAYWPALHGQFVWDDSSWTTEISGLLKDWSGLYSIWFRPDAMQQYYPLDGTTFWIDYHLWGFRPLPYHAENILLHATSALLFWSLLKRLRVPGAWLAGAIFAVHPLMVESVAWITERKNVLSMVLYLSALLAYGTFNSYWQEVSKPLPRRWGAYGLALVLFTAALLSKTTTFALPAVILLIYWWKQGRIRWADVWPTIPFFAVSIVLCKITANLEANHVGAKGPEWQISFVSRCLIAGRVFWFYIAKFLWPAQLIFIYPRWTVNPESWKQWLFPLSAIALLLTLWGSRNRVGRGPLAAALFYVGTLFPVLGFLNAYFMRYSFVSDHWTYLPSLSLYALAAAGLVQLSRYLRAPALPYGFAGAALPILAALTWRQCHVYSDLQTLWVDTLNKNPTAWLAHNNLGIIYREQGNLDEAANQYHESLRYNPTYAEAHNNLGVVLKRQGKIDQAVMQYELALKSAPNFPNAIFNLGLALEILGKNDDAIARYRQALQLEPDFFEAHFALAGILMHTGKIEESLQEYDQAVQIQPDSAKAHAGFALALARHGNLADAIANWQAALRIQPDFPEAECNWGYTLENSGDDGEAIPHFRRAIHSDPDFFEPHYNLGMILMRQGKFQDAATQFMEAVRIKPDSADAHNELALALLQAGLPLQAIEQWKLAVQIRPNYLEPLNGLAWLLATQNPSAGGDPVQAVTFARRACDLTQYQVPGYIDTLAAALASSGQFDAAIAADGKAADLAKTDGQMQLVAEIQSRLQLYRDGHPYRQNAIATSNQSNPQNDGARQ
jgi:tetratricopeptide (TPR) repeat protein